MNTRKRYHVSLYDKCGNEIRCIKRNSYTSALGWFVRFVDKCLTTADFEKVYMFDFNMEGSWFVCNKFDFDTYVH